MDKKTIIGIVLMGAIFIGYVMYSSKQQAKYQEYMEQVQAEQVKAEAEQAALAAEQAAIAADSTAMAAAAEQAANREVEMFGQTLSSARSAEVKAFTMSNDYLTVDFTTQGGMMSKVVLEEYTKYAPKDERNTPRQPTADTAKKQQKSSLSAPVFSIFSNFLQKRKTFFRLFCKTGLTKERKRGIIIYASREIDAPTR